MTWRKLFLGTGFVLLLLLVPRLSVLAEDKTNVDELAKAKLAEAAKVNTQCLKCHNHQPESIGQTKDQAAYIDSDLYQNSVHATLACVKCHDDVQAGGRPARILGSEELAEKINLKCLECHEDTAKVYEESAHGKLFLEGKKSALCVDCHGSHNIRKSTDPESKVYGMNSAETCLECHSQKYKETYEESFHGRAVFLGSTTAATCVSCHGSHTILGPDDPKSSVSKANVPKTCAQCHLKARENFSVGTEHAELKPTGPGAPTYWTLKFFVWLTIIVFTLLIIHIELELFRRYQNIKGKGEV